VQSKDDPIRRGVDRLGQRWGSNTASDPTKNRARELLAFPRGHVGVVLVNVSSCA